MQIRLNFKEDLSKAKEVEMLEKLFKTCQTFPNNYLASLFTQEFVSWCAWRIKDDFPLDVMEYINYDPESDVEALKSSIAQKSQDAQRLFDDCQKKQQTITEQGIELEGLRAELEALSNTEADYLREENIQLKARLFDLMNKEEPESE